MNGKFNVKTIINFDHAPLLSSVDQLEISKGIFLTNCNSNLLLETYYYLFTKSIEGRPWTTLLNHEQFFGVNQNLVARALKNKFLPSSVFFPL